MQPRSGVDNIGKTTDTEAGKKANPTPPFKDMLEDMDISLHLHAAAAHLGPTLQTFIAY